MAEGHPIFAFFWPFIGWVGDKLGMRQRRAELLASADGTIVEIGAGSGLNFRAYPAGAVVLATEPDPHMVKHTRKAAKRGQAAVTVAQAGADSLPAEDGSVDTVVSTWVLCSVPDVPAALGEIKRILKPSGKLLVIEHVRSDEPELAKKQDKGEKMQVKFGAGCHPNRDTLASLVAAGFDVGGIRKGTFPGPKLTRPLISGAAVKP